MTAAAPTIVSGARARPASAVAASTAPRLQPGALLALIGAGAVAAVSIWWTDTPSISGFGDWLTNAGRITGLLAGYAMVVLVALMARLPPVERGVGADRLARWHAMGGRYAVGLVAGHALLITWGYAVSAHTNVIHETGTLLTSYPDVLMATVAGGLLLGIGAVSARAARRRMSYETWYYLHFYTYLAVALAFSHQFAVGADFMTSLRARLIWGAMYALVAAAIVRYRFVLPAVRAYRHRLRVDRVVHEGNGVVSVWISGRELERLKAEPGQFFRWRFLTRELWWVSSPYSLSASPSPQLLRITVKGLGGHSAALANLTAGTRVIGEGPYGALTKRGSRRKTLMIAGGIGITPIRALMEAADEATTVLYRVSSETDAVFRPELEQLAFERNLRLHIVAGRRAELGCDPLSAANLKRNFPNLADYDVMLCGPSGMTASVSSALRSCGVPRRRIRHESFEF